jgi:hypothetical protein
MAKNKTNWWEIIAYIIGIGAIVFTIAMILIMVLK